MAPHKNIVLLVADDLGRDQIGCYGNHVIATPQLDRLAASGTRFTMAFASTASCSGSRTTIYTGLHTHQTGSYGLVGERNGFQTFPTVETAPQLFNDLGYKTGIIGKVHVSPETGYPWQVRSESETRDVAKIADEAESFFKDAVSDDKSFFLTIGYVDPHRQLATRGSFGNGENLYDPRIKDRVYSHEEVLIPPFLQDIPAVRQELSEYYRAIHRLDQGIGMVLDALERHGLAEDTLVMFLSDNGPPFVNSKTTLYDAGIHLPLIVRVPGKTPGCVNDNLVSWVDVLPTMLEWSGNQDLPPGPVIRRGRSFLSIVDSGSALESWDQRVFGSHTFHEITNYWPTRYLRTQRYKYHRNVCWKLDFPCAMDLYASLSFEGMRNADPPMIGKRTMKAYICRPAEELYDLEADPDEVNNLAQNASFKDITLSFRKDLEAWQATTEDLWLWKDGVSVQRFKDYNYEREGLKIPDRLDFDAENPSVLGCYSRVTST